MEIEAAPEAVVPSEGGAVELKGAGVLEIEAEGVEEIVVADPVSETVEVSEEIEVEAVPLSATEAVPLSATEVEEEVAEVDSEDEAVDVEVLPKHTWNLIDTPESSLVKAKMKLCVLRIFRQASWFTEKRK